MKTFTKTSGLNILFTASVAFAGASIACSSESDGVASADNNIESSGGTRPDQDAVDGQCSVAFTQAGGRCDQSAGADDNAFNVCLDRAKADLKTCCKTNKGSPKCADDAEPEQQNAADGRCFLDYARGGLRCDQSAGNDEAAFNACLAGLKEELKKCCADNGGSATCVSSTAP